MCVCVYVYVYVWGACMGVWACVCMNVWVHGCMVVCVYVYVCMCVCVYMCMGVCIYGCMGVWVHGVLSNPTCMLIYLVCQVGMVMHSSPIEAYESLDCVGWSCRGAWVRVRVKV